MNFGARGSTRITSPKRTIYSDIERPEIKKNGSDTG
jgi:hypothetical protein